MSLLCVSCTFGRSGREKSRETSAFSAGEPVPNEPEPFFDQIDNIEILEHQGTKTRQAIPPWLEAWLSGGDAAVEALEGYEDVYAFVAEEREDSPRVFENWLRNLNASRFFPRVAAVRFRFRFIRNLEAGVDQVYGGWYEAAIRAFYAARFTFVRKAGDFWIHERSLVDGTEDYRSFALLLVPRETFREEVYMLWDEAALDPRSSTSTNAQTAAFTKLKESFFEGF
jgi:hypothetical protein